MGWTKNLKVAYKIIGMVIVAVLAMITIGYTGYSYLVQSNQGMDVMYNRTMQGSLHLEEMQTTLRLVQTRSLQVLASHKQEMIADGKNNVSKAIAEYEKIWAVYEPIGQQVPESAEKLAETKKAFEEFKVFSIKEMELVQAGQQEEAVNVWESEAGRHAKDNIRDRLKQLQAIANAHAENIYQENAEATQAAVRTMVIKTVIALVVLLFAAVMLIRTIREPLVQMMKFCSRLGEGDFRLLPRNINRGDEFGKTVDVLVDMREKLNALMKGIANSTEQIAASSEELTASSQQAAQASTQSAASVTNAAAAVVEQQKEVKGATLSIDQVADSVQAFRSQAALVAEHSASAARQASDGAGAIDGSVAQIKSVAATVRESAEIVDKLGESSQEIGQIVDTISNIAAQTNLLALNAAIEAARAGEAGRGFAVVAEEVRKLAEESSTAAQKISELINGIQAETSKAVASMQQGRTAVITGAESVEGLREVFAKINVLVNNVSEQVTAMSQGVDRVAANASTVTDNITSINAQGMAVAEEMQNVSAATEEQSASAEEIASASDALAKLASEQQASLQRFKF